jgi:CheY-like chemotaxis protein
MKADKILIVDMDKPSVETLGGAIKRRKQYDILLATSSREAWGIFQKEQPALCLMEIILESEMDGLDLLRQLKKSGCRCIVMSASDNPAARKYCDAFLIKPFDMDKLLELIAIP